ncbi:positive regulation of interleukin-4-mediated signaling pathway [Branchiostoma belcheri]|nr:positive regulation of interleukin-4-mediated signaling pathway [Branchiostoma belcheri]
MSVAMPEVSRSHTCKIAGSTCRETSATKKTVARVQIYFQGAKESGELVSSSRVARPCAAESRPIFGRTSHESRPYFVFENRATVAEYGRPSCELREIFGRPSSIPRPTCAKFLKSCVLRASFVPVSDEAEVTSAVLPRLLMEVACNRHAPGRAMQNSTHEDGKGKVRTIKPWPEMPVDPARILLKGVADTVTEETLFLFLDAMSRGQNEPSEIFYGKEAGTVMVAFTEPVSNLDTLLARCEGRELGHQTLSAEKVYATNCIQVTGIPSTATHKDLLCFYFESPRSGGGNVAEIKLDKDRGTALIDFDDHTVTARVLKKSHKLQGKTLTVEPFYTCLQLGASSPTNPMGMVLEQFDKAYKGSISAEPKDTRLYIPRESEEKMQNDQEEDKTVAIEVTGITGDELEKMQDVLRYYFENTKRSGGGDISQFDMDTEKGHLLITFEDKEVTVRVLKKSHKILGKTLTVEPVYTCLQMQVASVPTNAMGMVFEQFDKAYKGSISAQPNDTQHYIPRESEEKMQNDQEEDKTVAIEVTGITGDELEKMQDVLRYYFENTKRSGGGDISQFDMDTEKGHLLITFEDKEAPGRVMQKSTHEVGRTKLKVRMVKPRPELPVDPTRILLKGVADTVTKETLFLFLDAMSRGQNEPSEIFYGKEAGTVMVAFAEPISNLDTLLTTCEGKELEHQTISAEKVYATNCIQVTGIPSSASDDYLCIYFENTRRSGGGDVAEIKLDKDRGTALITFDDHNVTARVLKKSHKLHGKTLTVEPFYTCLQLDASIPTNPMEMVFEQLDKSYKGSISARPKDTQLYKPRESEEKMQNNQEEDKTVAIEVTGLTGDELEKMQDVLRYYFENTKRSGGGDISQFDMDTEKGHLLITFEDKEAPGRVMQKSTHEVGRKKLKVRTVKPRPELPVDPTRILLKGVADTVTKETLFLFLEAMSRGKNEPSEIFYGKEAGTVMVAFTEPVAHLDTLLARCDGRELEHQTISAEKVYATNCIQVTGIPSSASEDLLFIYFESTKRSGGGSVAELQLDRDRGTALIAFDDHNVTAWVLKKSHKLQGKTLTVEPFYTCLQLHASIPTNPMGMVFEQLDKSYKSSISAQTKDTQLYIPREKEDKTVAIEVTGLTGDELEKMQDVLRYYFENTKRSGGGDISQFDMDTEKGHLLITFEDKEAMSRGQNKPCEVFYGKEAGTVMVAFTEPISNLDTLLARCEGTKVEHQTISAEKVYATNCIQVTGIPSTATKDILFYYFESIRRSGGGDVAEVKLDKDRGTALVLFKDHNGEHR